jgi:hypothetical protein
VPVPGAIQCREILDYALRVNRSPNPYGTEVGNCEEEGNEVLYVDIDALRTGRPGLCDQIA